MQVEKNNQHLSINVFGLEDKQVYPLRLSSSPQDSINLMLLHDDETATSHWVWVRDFGRLCADRTKHRGHLHYCMRCLSSHNTPATLQKHLTYCNDHDAVATIMPKEGEHLEFTNYHKKLKCPYVSISTPFFF